MFEGRQSEVQRKLTVWHLSSNRWNSAVTEFALSSLRALDRAGHQVIYTGLTGSLGQDRATSYGIATLPIPDFGIRRIPALRRACEEIRPNVILLFGGPETTLARFLPKGPLLVRFRGTRLESKDVLLPGFFRWSHSHLDLVLAPSRLSRTRLVKALPDRLVRTVELGTDTDFFRANLLNNRSGSRPELLVIARLDPVKGHHKLLQIFRHALNIWPQRAPKPRLRIIGCPENVSLSQLKHWCTTLNLRLNDDIILMPRRIPNVVPFIANATLGIIPSLWSEEIVRVAQEFLCCGTPIFVSGVGALEEALTPGRGTSYRGLLPHQAAELLIDQIMKASAETANQRLSRAADAKQQFSLDRMAHQLFEAFEITSKTP